MATEPQRLTDLERSNLVAYLDQELEPAEADFLRTKLTKSVTARREIESLEKTWELLDHLPRPHTSEDFTERTLTHILELDADHGKLDAASHWVSRLGVAALSGLAVVLLTFGIGYVGTRWMWPDPTARLARDLPLAEHLDAYRAVGTFEFLKMLDTLPELNEDQP